MNGSIRLTGRSEQDKSLNHVDDADDDDDDDDDNVAVLYSITVSCIFL
jgi:hypothetical protein